MSSAVFNLDSRTAACERCGCTHNTPCAISRPPAPPVGCTWDAVYWSMGRAVCTACRDEVRQHDDVALIHAVTAPEERDFERDADVDELEATSGFLRWLTPRLSYLGKAGQPIADQALALAAKLDAFRTAWLEEQMRPPPAIAFQEEDGRERMLVYDAGDSSVGIPGGYIVVDIDTTFGQLAIGARFTARSVAFPEARSDGPSWAKLNADEAAIVGKPETKRRILTDFPVRLEVC